MKTLTKQKTLFIHENTYKTENALHPVKHLQNRKRSSSRKTLTKQKTLFIQENTYKREVAEVSSCRSPGPGYRPECCRPHRLCPVFRTSTLCSTCPERAVTVGCDTSRQRGACSPEDICSRSRRSHFGTCTRVRSPAGIVRHLCTSRHPRSKGSVLALQWRPRGECYSVVNLAETRETRKGNYC